MKLTMSDIFLVNPDFCIYFPGKDRYLGIFSYQQWDCSGRNFSSAGTYVPLRDAAEKKDIKTLKSVAHSMRGTVSYVGLGDQLIQSLKRIENSAENGFDNSALLSDLDYVKKTCHDVVRQLEIDLPKYAL